MNRDKVIVRTSIIGIIANVFLAAFKAAVGLISHSIAVTLDAVNNLSDALSSVITIVGTKLAAKSPDKKHPLGYGRIEYLSAMIVAAIVLYAGITSAVESIKKIIHPEAAEYSTVSLIIIAVAIAVKILLGLYVRKQGKKVSSGALTASGSDALFDAILSASVLASAIVYIITGLSLEAYVGVVISGFIIKAGIEMMIETLNDILGKRADAELSKQIKTLITEEPEVRGAYDLLINNYGPDKNVASVHIELSDTMTVDQVDVLTRRLQRKVFTETGVILTGVGVYSYNTQDDEAARVRNKVQEIVMDHEWALQMHGFYADAEAKTMRFDVVMSFDVEQQEGLQTLYKEVKEAFPDYEVVIAPDVDISD
ncbi:MAG: cation transporter [Lachnospiraceae bacterium]|nr:cation transporter [Lachnospiraceae bacterium]